MYIYIHISLYHIISYHIIENQEMKKNSQCDSKLGV